MRRAKPDLTITSAILVEYVDGRLAIEFSAPTKRYNMTPQQAREVASLLIVAADNAKRPDNVVYFPPPVPA